MLRNHMEITDSLDNQERFTQRLEEHSSYNTYIQSEIQRITNTDDLSQITVLSLPPSQIKLVIIPEVINQLINLNSFRATGAIKRIENLNLLKNLSLLDLSHNQISRIHEGLQGLTSLETLILDFNPIERIDHNEFRGLRKLKRVSLKATKINNLWTAAFALREIPNLTHLSFQRHFLCNDGEPMVEEEEAYVAEDESEEEDEENIMHYTFQPNSFHNINFYMVPAPQRSSDSEDEDFPNEIENEEMSEDEKDDHTFVNRSPICFDRFYRQFMVYHLPNLVELDDVPVKCSGESAESCYSSHFESVPYEAPVNNLFHNLMHRELGNFDKSIAHSPRKFQESSIASRYCSRSADIYLNNPGIISELGPSPIIGKSLAANIKTPRQFEYHPARGDRLVFGTTTGEVVLINPHLNVVIAKYQMEDRRSSVLALSWLHKDVNKFIVGTDSGTIRILDVHRMEDERKRHFSYPEFPRLSSVSVNCTDDRMIASGRSDAICLYDMESGHIVHTIPAVHSGYINVSKFSNHSPYLLATSSFDRTIKLWDIRERLQNPIFTRSLNTGVLMVAWSPDDQHLLVSAVDNEVAQFNSVDGSLNQKFLLPKIRNEHNYTRSYYMKNGEYVCVGSTEESVIRIVSAKTGKLLRDVTFYDKKSSYILEPYTQSLRGDPFNEFEFTALIAYKTTTARIYQEAVLQKVNLLEEGLDTTIQ